MSFKKTLLGIDAGSVSLSVVKMDTDKNLMASDYRFHHGDIGKTLQQILEVLGIEGVTHVVATGSTPALVQAQKRYDNQIAVIEAARQYHPDMRAVLVVGGEKFFYSTFNEQGHYAGSTFNTSCAAGTGSFLDQQASRLKMRNIEELSATACHNRGRCPKIASRCAVFAKTDLIHAQQEGYQYEEISDGLCHGLAKNIVDTLFSADTPPGEILFCGGVSRNRAVAGHIEKLASISLKVPEQGNLYGAIGAVLCFLEEVQEIPPLLLTSPAAILRSSAALKQYHYPPLQLSHSRYPDFSSLERYEYGGEHNNPVEVDIYQALNGEERVYLGVDIGSTSTKAVILNEQEEVLAGLYTRTAGRPLPAVQHIFEAISGIEKAKNIRFEVVRCATTGSGRKFIGKIIGADIVLDEITAHARAAIQLDPNVDTIIEIGGQDAKFTTLQNGRVTSSTMNNVCAAGTGSFIEEQAARLGCAIDEYGARAEGVSSPMASDRCTVFMERDINHHLSEGFSVNEVLASALHSVRENYLMKVASEKNIGNSIFFQGATAKNRPLVAAFEQRLQKPIMVSKYCHLTGALGGALIAREEMKHGSTSFRGLGLSRKHIPVSSEVCELCNNNCKISIADTPSGKVAYGFLCGREYEDTAFVQKETGAIDLLRTRRRLLVRKKNFTPRDKPVIGLPAAVHMVDDLPFWQNFFAGLGVRTISSSPRKDILAGGRKISLSEFCAPITAMHGHVDYLLERSDYVFLPYYLENKNSEARRQFCYYTQFLPGVIATIGARAEGKILSPVIRYLYTPFHAKIELYRMLRSILADPPGFLEVSKAYDLAEEQDRNYRHELKKFFGEHAGKRDDVEVVLVGRPYTILSPSLNCGIPELFAAQGINTYFQDMIPYDEEDIEEIAPLLGEIHWQHSAKILEVAEVVSRMKGVYPVYITSFKCSPDSFTLDYFKAVMEANNKPYLILELDEHDSSIGYETRIEAAVRSFRNHYRQEKVRTDFPPLPDYRHINPQLEDHPADKTIVLPNWDRITCAFLTAVLEREGYQAYTMLETDATIRRSLKYNSGQCIPLNAVAEGFTETMRHYNLAPEKTVLWLNRSTLACNIRLYPHHIKTILNGQGMESAGIYVGNLNFADISMRAAMNGYFSYMFGGLLRRVACAIRPYELEKGTTDRVLEKSIHILCDAFRGKRSKEEALSEVISHFQWIETRKEQRPKVAIFGDVYVRDNRVMNQDLIRFIERHGGEVITTPYSEYAKMIAGTYFRKWFNEGKYLDMLSNRAILATMLQLEKKYSMIFDRILGNSRHAYDDRPEDILAGYNISVENTGESMDNILKIHYIKKYYSDVSLFVQASPALCCASLITEAMKKKISEKTGVPVVSVVYDGTGGEKNSVIVPYLKYGQRKGEAAEKLLCRM
jgi:predicted CoA-substrate-specific enzyme activase